MTDLTALKAANAERWTNANAIRRVEFVAVAKRLIAPSAKQRYQAAEAKTGVPWYFIAVVHEREASQRWNTQLGQGDPLGCVSVHVPTGRGPFKSWVEAAVDALVNCSPHAARNKDWSIGGLLTMLEQYNGLGYAVRGIPSPYIWSGTDQYEKAKFTGDGRFDPNAIDKQLGCAGLLLAMMALDPSIRFTGGTIMPAHPASTIPDRAPPGVPKPSVTNPSRGSVGAFIASILFAIFNFRRK
jgi:lysozyme family protein